MKKPWMIGLLSVVPGLGLLALGETRKGIWALAGFGALVAIGLGFQNDTVFSMVFVLAIIVWVTQMMLAVTYAQRQARYEDGTALAPRPVTVAPAPEGATAGEKLLQNARQKVTELLPPGEQVKVALDAKLGVSSMSTVLLDLLGWHISDPGESVYLGATGQDLVIVNRDMLGGATKLRRIPLAQVRLGKNNDGIIFDEFFVDLGDGKMQRVRVGAGLHQGTRQMLAALGRQDAAPAAAPAASYSQAPGPSAVGIVAAPPVSFAGKMGTAHPLVLSALLGALGGMAGALAAALVILLLGMALGQAITGTGDFGEGLGYFVGLYCLVMFPIGGGILGAIPGLIVGSLRAGREEPITLMPLAVPGFLTVLVLSVGAVVGMFLLA